MTKKQQIEIQEACEKLVEQGKLVEIDYDTDNPKWQETEAFLSNLWGVIARYDEKCVKCGEPVDKAQESYTRCVVNNDFQILHEYCQKNNGLKWTVKEIENILTSQQEGKE